MEYLEINRDDKRYCDGCPALTTSCDECTSGIHICNALDKNITVDYYGKTNTPPNCPLKSFMYVTVVEEK
jgi:hypothetical protein